MLSPNIKEYLSNHKINYETIGHLKTYTAQQSAQAAHIKGRYFVKCVVVKLDDKFTLVAVPANFRIDIEALKQETNAKQVEIAREYEFQDQFKDCETGAMPPFGDLYNMDVYLAKSLAHRKWLAFNAGNHNELLKVNCKDFLDLVHPKTLLHC